MTAAEEWMSRFERETGKTIREGRLAFIDPDAAVQRAIMEFRLHSPAQPKRIRLSAGVHKDLVVAALRARQFIGNELTQFAGVPTETDHTLPEGMLVVE